VPVVSHGSELRPLKTGVSMTDGSDQLSPLWPGSMPTTFPASGSGGALVVLTLSLVIYALQVPTLIGFTVARFD